jgi:serine/threonine protein kinase
MNEEKKEDEIEPLGESKNNMEEVVSKKKKKKHKKKGRKKKDDDKKDKKLYANDKFILNGIYRIIKMVGCGAFGEIHLAYDVNMKALRAIKFEMANHKNPQLKHEYSVLEQLNKQDGVGGLKGADTFTGVPKVYYFDRLEHKYNFMVMEFLGPSLGDLFQLKERNFGMETVLMIAIQVLSRIEYIHEKGFLHRDIKPENFVIGLNEKSNLVYLIDYGLSKRYKDKNSGQHIPYRENKQLVGTVRYASVNAHLGIEQSRRDDLEGIGYVLVYFYLGRLPWQNKTDKGKPLTQKITEKKLTTPPELLCKKMPREFSYYFHYCKNLKFEDRPDYNSLKSMFADLLMSRMKLNGIKELIYDWFDEENNYRERKKKEMISSSNNKSEIIKYEEENINNNNNNEKNNELNKIEEKEDNKEESNLTGTIGKQGSNIIEEEKQGDDIINEKNEEENNEKNDKSSISSESGDEKKNEEEKNENDNNNKEDENNKEENNNNNLIKENNSEQKRSGSYGLLGNDEKKKNEQDKKDEDNSNHSEEDDN